MEEGKLGRVEDWKSGGMEGWKREKREEGKDGRMRKLSESRIFADCGFCGLWVFGVSVFFLRRVGLETVAVFGHKLTVCATKRWQVRKKLR